MDLNSLNDVLAEQLGELYNAEQQLAQALPRLAAAAHSYDLRTAFEQHHKETRSHIARLDEIFSEMGIRFVPATESKGMSGLVADCDAIASSDGDPVALDAALIGAAQRCEHFEIASYGTARALAGELGLKKVSLLLEATLNEESRANKALTKLAAGGMMSSGINRLAADRSNGHEDEEPEPVAQAAELSS